MLLHELAERLNQPALLRIAKSFSEERIAGLRNLVLLALLGWAAYWGSQEGTRVLFVEGRAVLPYLAGMLLINLAWWGAIRAGWVKGRWIDYAGTAAHFIGIAILLSVAWNLMLPTVMFLPLGAITAAARFKTPYFFGWMGFSVLVVGLAAANGYWQSRPAIAALALALLIGLPMTVVRLMKALEAVSVAAVHEFEEAVKARDAARNFLATMSHELRSPLQSMVTANELLSVEAMTPTERELAETARSSGRLLMRRINDVLDVAALERGAMRLQGGVFNLRNAVESVRLAVESEADAKGVSLGVTVADDVPLAVTGDVSRFEQVLQNLLDNAVKYTRAGGKVELTVGTGETGWLDLVVTDTGIGIPDHEKPKVFDAHHQVSRGDARRYGGVGLGLHIVKRLSGLMGGSVEIGDNPGGGTVFRWSVPLPSAGNEAAEASMHSSVAALDDFRHRHPRMRILVIDDNAAGREVLRKLLERAGQQVVVSPNGTEGLAALAEESFDIVLLDLHMPLMDGFGVMAAINMDRERYGTPTIVVVSAASDDASIARAMALGARHYVTKPILPEALTAALDRVISG